MLALTILCLLSWIQLTFAQTTLGLNTITSLTTSSTFSIPSSSSPLNISVALCSPTYTATPHFWVSNGTGSSESEITLTDGWGTYNGSATTLRVENGGNYQVGLSDTNTTYLRTLSDPPMFGDSTATQAVLFSPVFEQLNLQEPSWPNYSLPSADMAISKGPSRSPNYTLLLSLDPLMSMPQTACSVMNYSTAFNSSAAQSGQIRLVSTEVWPKDISGWRMKWVLEGLQANTNYTAYVVEGGSILSGPMYFKTKTDTFGCSLVTALPYCPSVNYAVPIAPPNEDNAFYTSDNLDSAISDPVISAISNFTVALRTFACGRDIYSPLTNCFDCQREYRQWLCTTSFIRCTEDQPDVKPAPAIVDQPTTARNENLPDFDGDYKVLLPCLETCNAVDRACPAFLGFTCPTKQFRASNSYGVGYIDGGDFGADIQQGGLTKAAQDRYGNVWCQL